MKRMSPKPGAHGHVERNGATQLQVSGIPESVVGLSLLRSTDKNQTSGRARRGKTQGWSEIGAHESGSPGEASGRSGGRGCQFLTPGTRD